MDQFPFEQFFREQMEVTRQSGKEIYGHCPFHDDKSASFSACISGEKSGLVKCFSQSCGFKGHLFQFIEKKFGVDNKEAFNIAAKYAGVELIQKGAVSARPPISLKLVEKLHNDLLTNPDFAPKLEFLKSARGLTEDTIKRFKIGFTSFKGQRYTIPIFGSDGEINNIRYYGPGDNEFGKFLNHIYKNKEGVVFSYKEPHHCFTDWNWFKTAPAVIICAGEMDAAILWQNDFCSFTELAGEGTWSEENNYLFRDKAVVIIYDNDEAGRKGALKVLHSLRNVAQMVSIYNLPEEVGPGGDITDYFVKLGRTQNELRQALQDLTPLAQKAVKEDISVNSEIISLGECLKESRYYSQYNRFKAQVMGIARDPLTVPKYIELNCHYSTKCREQKTCPILMHHNGNLKIDLTKQPDIFYLYVVYSKRDAESLIKKQIGLSRSCYRLIQYSPEVVSVVELQVTPRIVTGKLSITREDNVEATVFYVGSKQIRENTSYTFTGKPEENPKNHKTAIIAYDAAPELDELDSFRITPEVLGKLHLFKKPADVSVSKHIENIAKDISINIFKMVGTYNLAYAVFFTVFSPQNFVFNTEFVHRGWANTLVIGDTGTGKSESFNKFNDWCACAEIINGERVSLAGLIGGMAKGHNQTMVRRQGVLGRNDRRMVFWDEFKEADKEIIAMLTGVRSEGVIRYSKLDQWTSYARTRILMYTSPKGNSHTLASYKPPIKAILPIFNHSREDIRRTDYVFLLHSDEVPPEKINSLNKETVAHVYSQENFQELIRYAWNGNADNIWFHPETESLILRECLRLGTKYSEKIPLIDPKSYRFKLARAGITYAYLCFSVNENQIERYVNGETRRFQPGELLEVYPEHIIEFLAYMEKHLDSDKVGFYELSIQEKMKKEGVSTINPEDLFERILPRLKLKYHTFKDVFFGQSIKEFGVLQLMFCPYDYRNANILIAYLTENHIIEITENKHVKYNSALLEPLKKRLDEYCHLNRPNILTREANYDNGTTDNIFGTGGYTHWSETKKKKEDEVRF